MRKTILGVAAALIALTGCSGPEPHQGVVRDKRYAAGYNHVWYTHDCVVKQTIYGVDRKGRQTRTTVCLQYFDTRHAYWVPAEYYLYLQNSVHKGWHEVGTSDYYYYNPGMYYKG